MSVRLQDPSVRGSSEVNSPLAPLLIREGNEGGELGVIAGLATLDLPVTRIVNRGIGQTELEPPLDLIQKEETAGFAPREFL